MIRVEIDATINQPAPKVFDFIANPENNPLWQSGMKSCKVITEGDLGLGSEYAQEAEFMGKPILTTFKITEFKAGHLIKGASIISTFPITFTRMVESHGSGCKVTAMVTGAPTGMMGWFPFMTKWMINRSITADYRRLKKLLETTKMD